MAERSCFRVMCTGRPYALLGVAFLRFVLAWVMFALTVTFLTLGVCLIIIPWLSAAALYVLAALLHFYSVSICVLTNATQGTFYEPATADMIYISRGDGYTGVTDRSYGASGGGDGENCLCKTYRHTLRKPFFLAVVYSLVVDPVMSTLVFLLSFVPVLVSLGLLLGWAVRLACPPCGRQEAYKNNSRFSRDMMDFLMTGKHDPWGVIAGVVGGFVLIFISLHLVRLVGRLHRVPIECIAFQYVAADNFAAAGPSSSYEVDETAPVYHNLQLQDGVGEWS